MYFEFHKIFIRSRNIVSARRLTLSLLHILKMWKFFQTHNLFQSFCVLFRLQRLVGIFPYCVSANRLYRNRRTFLVTMIIPTFYISYVFYKCIAASFRITGTELSIFTRVFGEFFYVSLVFLANYKSHLQRQLYEHLQSVDAIMEDHLKIPIDHQRVFRMTLKGCCLITIVSGVKVSYSLKAWTLKAFIVTAADLVQMQINSINAFTYFMCAYAIMVRMEQLSQHLISCIRGKVTIAKSAEAKEQMMLDLCMVHALLRNGVSEMNTLYAKRVFLTYFREGFNITLSFYYIYSALVGSGVWLPMSTMVVNACVNAMNISTLCIFCHFTIRYVSLVHLSTWISVLRMLFLQIRQAEQGIQNLGNLMNDSDVNDLVR